MSDNSFDFIQMAGATLLFVFALSCGIFSYSQVNSRVNQYINVNTYNRRGTATSAYGDEDDIMRKTDRSEIIMSVASLPRTTQTRGNENYTIRVVNGENICTFSMRRKDGEEEMLIFSPNNGATQEKYYTDANTTHSDDLNKLIKKYWFIKKDIKNDKLYYALEGYLFPDTYQIDKETTTIEEIFDMMLNQMETILNEYKTEINKSSYSVHKLLTLASVTQSEGYNEEDFKNIASVFYNRMAIDMPLGSCVTSYYGVKKEMTNELLLKDINAKNAYNTRGEDPVLFPVGPISAPGKKAI